MSYDVSRPFSSTYISELLLLLIKGIEPQHCVLNELQIWINSIIDELICVQDHLSKFKLLSMLSAVS